MDNSSKKSIKTKNVSFKKLSVPSDQPRERRLASCKNESANNLTPVLPNSVRNLLFQGSNSFPLLQSEAVKTWTREQFKSESPEILRDWQRTIRITPTPSVENPGFPDKNRNNIAAEVTDLVPRITSENNRPSGDSCLKNSRSSFLPKISPKKSVKFLLQDSMSNQRNFVGSGNIDEAGDVADTVRWMDAVSEIPNEDVPRVESSSADEVDSKNHESLLDNVEVHTFEVSLVLLTLVISGITLLAVGIFEALRTGYVPDAWSVAVLFLSILSARGGME